MDLTSLFGSTYFNDRYLSKHHRKCNFIERVDNSQKLVPAFDAPTSIGAWTVTPQSHFPYAVLESFPFKYVPLRMNQIVTNMGHTYWLDTSLRTVKTLKFQAHAYAHATQKGAIRIVCAAPFRHSRK